MQQMAEPFLVAFSPTLENWRSVLESGIFAAAGRSLVVGVVTAVGTLVLAPRVDQGVLLGVGTALAVHLWRELKVGVPSRLDGDTLHVWPTGVLYFGSAPGVERSVTQLIAQHTEVQRIVVHLGRLGRVDLTGALMLRDVLDEVRAAGVGVELTGAKGHAAKLLSRVLEDDSLLE